MISFLVQSPEHEFDGASTPILGLDATDNPSFRSAFSRPVQPVSEDYQWFKHLCNLFDENPELNDPIFNCLELDKEQCATLLFLARENIIENMFIWTASRYVTVER